jgi:hypothetical protein
MHYNSLPIVAQPAFDVDIPSIHFNQIKELCKNRSFKRRRPAFITFSSSGIHTDTVTISIITSISAARHDVS